MAQVFIQNKRAHKVPIAVQVAGKLTSVDLPPYEKHGPIDEADVGQLTKNLAFRGHVKIRPAK